jgi:phosphoserine aminotransferase
LEFVPLEFPPFGILVFGIFDCGNFAPIMTPTTHTHWGLNFNSGPSILPKEVFNEASRSITDFLGTGLSILEIGHRTPLFQEVLDETKALAKELMELDEDHEVLFLHGGATTQFFQIPMNLLNENETAAYLDAGTWGTKAIKEAKNFGKVHLLGTSKDKGYTYIYKDYEVPAGVKYVHITSNNTIEGTQQHFWPSTVAPLIADMSSDILSRKMDFNRFDLIYAGAQKNIGAAGVTLVVVNKKLLGKVDRNLPAMMNYRNHIEAGSMLNTPPVFAIYVCLLTLRWLKNLGGIDAIEPINQQKARLLYDTLDKISIYQPTVAMEDRSLMNVVWVMEDPRLDTELLALSGKEGITGIQGHRTAGGFRASLYNAMPMDGAKTLVQLLEYFAAKKG